MSRKQVNVRLPEDLYDLLVAFCAEHGVSVNSFLTAQVVALRFALEQFDNDRAFTWEGPLGSAWQKVILDARIIDAHGRKR